MITAKTAYSSKTKHSNYIATVILLLLAAVLFSGCTAGWISGHAIEITGDKSFTDSMGKAFTVDEPYEKVITLYSAHTENAFTIGAGDRIIGVNTTSIYPPEAAELPMYDYKSDPEPLIAAQPDLVIIRPFINRNYNDFVKAITKAGIPVVSLYPADNSEFEAYVRALGIIFGAADEVEEELLNLELRLEDIQATTSQIPESDRVHAYFESTKTAYRTVTVDSNPAMGIEIAGGINVASDVKPITKGSTIAEFGIEKLMINADQIDVYVSQRGAMNAGGSLISIPQREGFRAIKAVGEGRILELNEKLISSPTFRYDKGVREMARMFYPDLMDDISGYLYEEAMNREDYACMTVMLKHTPIFVPSSAHYYEKDHKVHTYGAFEDVNWQDNNYDFIETAVLNSYIRAQKQEDGTVLFDGQGMITRADLAYTLYIMNDVRPEGSSSYIKDLDRCQDQRIIQKIVDAGLMSLDQNDHFNPDDTVSGIEAVTILTKALTLSKDSADE